MLSEIEQSIKRKIEAAGKPLREWDVKINRGVLTGCNEAFIIDGATKNRLISEDPKSAELIRPILRGRDIKRYGYEFADRWIIALFPSLHYEISDYPAIESFLRGFRPKLEQSGRTLSIEEREAVTAHAASYGINILPKDLTKARKKTGNKWFETQDAIAYWDDLDKRKIIWGELSDRPKFALDVEGRFSPLNTAFLMTGNLLAYLVAFLNSPVSKYYFSSNIATSSGVGTIRWLKYTIETLPIPKASEAVIEHITKLVEEASVTDNPEQDITRIDDLIFEIYGFTNEEIDFIRQAAGL